MVSILDFTLREKKSFTFLESKINAWSEDSSFTSLFLIIVTLASIIPSGSDSNISNTNLDLDSMLSHPPLLL